MIRNYLKIAFRHLQKSKLYSAINITGLAIGITCVLLAVLYWNDERSFDEFHKNNPNLFRITTSLKVNKEADRSTLGGTGQVQGPAFKAAVPEVKNYTRILGGDIYTNLSYQSKTLHLQPLFVDSSFFDVFSFSFLRGDPARALSEVNSVVITESTAKKFFSTTDAVGKVFTMESDPSYERLQKPLMVSAVIKDPPHNSSLQFDLLFTFEFMRLSFEDNNWLNNYLGTFVVLQPRVNKVAVTEKFNAVYQLHAKSQFGNPEFDIHGYDPQIKYGLQPMTAVHFNRGISVNGFNNNEGGIINGSSPVYSYVFMGIALFILLMAAINFINISIAGSLKRSKEVGVRKISGSNRRQIIFQFLLESALLCIAAFFLSVVLMNMMLPLFNTVTGKQLSFTDVFDWKLILYFIFLLFSIILFTGIYPAFVLSNFKAAEVLYNKQKLNGRNLFGRSLLVLQFSLAVFLLIGALVYYNQMDFIRTKDLGYNPYNIIRTSVYGNRNYQSLISYLKNELAKVPSIQKVSFGNDGNFEDMEVNSHAFKSMHKGIDENYLSLMQIPLKQGRNLSSAVFSDTKTGALVNEAFVKAAGLQEPVGKTILINRHYDSTYKTIIGVVKDYHFGSLREPVKPMLMSMPENAEGSAGIWIKFDKTKQQEALKAVEKVYMAAMPKALYQYDFIDELNAREYIKEQRWQKVVNVSTLLAFALCSLGLFGLAHLAAGQRVKEIGIRKTLGATVSQLTVLLTKDFLKLVFLSLIIAFPVAWFVADKWLQNYAYRIELSWWLFLMAGLLAAFIAIFTVGIQAIKASLMNPVKNLRTD